MDDIFEKKRKREFELQNQSRLSVDDSTRPIKSYRESKFDEPPPNYRGDDRYHGGGRGGGNYRGDDRYRGNGDYRGDDRYNRDYRPYNNGGRDYYDKNREPRDRYPQQLPPQQQYQQQQQQQQQPLQPIRSNIQQQYQQPPLQPVKPIIPQPTKEELEKQREEEKQKEIIKMEEEMRLRREKVELWRKQKLEAEQQQQQSTANSTTTDDINKWSLEDEEDEEKGKGVNEVAKTNGVGGGGSGDDDIDTLDAFMDNLNEDEIDKPSTKSELIDGDEQEFEEEDSDEDDGEEKQVKKGKSEILKVDHSKINYHPFEKSFYVEVPSLSALTETEVLDYRSDLGLKITGKNCPKPIQTWSQVGLNEKLYLLLKKYNYEKPTSIQAQTIPAAMMGRDLIGIAKTGSGKTLAFLLPMFRHILAQPKSAPGEGMTALIMSPTRELALQIFSECKKFTKILGLKAACVYGGASMSEQIADLKRGADIVVCTPGRMIDILCANNKRITNLRRVTFLVLDEADRMFDLGFGPQIMCVVDNIRPDRQTIMFSATFPPKVENAAKRILKKPLEIIAGGRSVVSSEIEQIVEVRPNDTRFRRLMELLSIWYHKGQILIFTNKQETTDNLFRLLMTSRYNCLSLHGSKDQTDRDETISDFKNKVKTILIATPLASRGLDIKDLNCVINFDCPDHLEDYVHRVGRTGRAGNKGTAYTFITPTDERYAASIIKALEQSNTKVPEELIKLDREYQKKKLEGKDVPLAPTGFTGRGHKFDASEEQKKILERKLLKKNYGIEDDEEEVEMPIEDETTTTPVVPTATTTTTGTSPTTPTITSIIPGVQPVPQPPGVSPPTTTPGATALPGAKEVPIELQVKSQVFGSGQVANSKDTIKAIQAQIFASKQQVKVPIIHFQEELEINDYSQQARWKATHKDSLSSITDFTNTSITPKGTFFAPGKNPQQNERKLYLLIEGPSEMSVKTAKFEIKKFLDEIQVLSGDKGKYSVF